MFSGVSTLTIDSKGRMAIPAKQRDLLSALGHSRLVLAPNPEGCLNLYPESEWLLVRERLNQLSGAQSPIRRVIVGNAEELETDGSGRILLSANLRALARLEKNVALVGAGNKFELWDETRWNQLNQDVMNMDSATLTQNMQGIVL